jgi:nitrate/TMAO reductase-like tetraheme cytochrome c subunit
MRRHALTLALVALPATVLAQQKAPAPTSCIACHGDKELWDEAALKIVSGTQQGAHAAKGLSCHDCHGGNPDPALAEDAEAAMSKAFRPNPFRGVPARGAIPAFCGRCHSDPAYMKRFNPSLRVDQQEEYWTSQHGKALKRGDDKVATCVDCHGVHGILAPGNPASPVYPTHVAETCRSCHADAARMKGRHMADGRPLPIDQYARWRRSVHAAALLDKGDLSAPTCNDCHGNHGATPPGLESIALVCGQCHGREAELFRASPKFRGFESHNKMLAEAGATSCSDCHEPPAPQAKLEGVTHLSECVSCHGNHGVARPTVALLAPLPDTPCAFCHEGPESPATRVEEPEASRRRYQAMRASLLEAGKAQHLEGQPLFDWLVDQALALPTHTAAAPSAGGNVELRPEFQRLFTKFRIGKSYTSYEDPSTGEEHRLDVVRCSSCHESGKESVGLQTATAFLDRMREVTGLTARAERILLAAKRGGVETRGALLSLDHAVDAQIEMEVLVHTFSSAEGSPFVAKSEEGLSQARGALDAGQVALDELRTRRRGLAVSSFLIVLVLVGLALKIRQLSATDKDGS